MTDSLPPPNDPHVRWKFFRDVVVFQLKLMLGNVQNFALVPVSIAAAIMDVAIKGDREGEKFYKVMDWGRRTDEMINVYSAIGGYHATGGEDDHAMKSDFSVDSVLARIEGVIVREYEKGGTAANIKGAVDRAIDEMQTQSEKGKNKIDDVIQRTAEKFKPKYPPQS